MKHNSIVNIKALTVLLGTALVVSGCSTLSTDGKTADIITPEDIAREIAEEPAAAGRRTKTSTAGNRAATSSTTNSLTLSTSGNGRTLSVTYNFSADVQYGKFLDGSYWVAPYRRAKAVTIDSVTAVGGTVKTDENPVFNQLGLTDGSRNYGNHSPNETLSFPTTRGQNTILVSAIQKDEAKYGACGHRSVIGECIDAIFPLTILTSPPPADSLRPAFNSSNKSPISLSDFDLTKIPYAPYFAGTSTRMIASHVDQLTRQTEAFSVSDLSTKLAYSSGGRAWRSDINGKNYGSATGAWIADLWSYVMAADLSNPTTLEQYKPLVAALLVYANDLNSALYNGTQRKAGWWGVDGGGHHNGKLLPVAIYSALKYRNNNEYTNLANLIPAVGNYALIPPELEYLNAGPNGIVWGDGPDSSFSNPGLVGRYWDELLKSQCFDGAPGTCNQNIGKKTFADPHRLIDGPPVPGTTYFYVTFGTIQSFAGVMAIMPSMRSMINSKATGDHATYKDAPINFVDARLQNGLPTSNDHCAPPDPRENPETCDARRNRGCEYYGYSNTGAPTWGPDPSDTDWSDGLACIQNSKGQTGRYPSWNGKPITAGYTSSNFRDNWSALRANLIR